MEAKFINIIFVCQETSWYFKGTYQDKWNLNEITHIGFYGASNQSYNTLSRFSYLIFARYNQVYYCQQNVLW